MIRVAIVEDEPECRQQLEAYLNKYGRERGIEFHIRQFPNGDGITNHYKSDFDLILLDVEMPFVDGFETAALIRQQDPEVVIIFITNMAQYAIKGYSVDALDYVVKPVSYFAFSQYIGRAIDRMESRKQKYLLLPVGRGLVKVAVSSIYYIECQDHSQNFYTKTGNYRSSGKLKEIEALLEPWHFFRCHTGYLVNLRYVDGYADGFALVNQEKIPVSRYRKREFLDALSEYISEVRK